MKHLLQLRFKIGSFLFLLAFASLLGGSGCKDDDAVSFGKQLEGDWQATSFKFDGEEALGFQGDGGINQFEIELSDFNDADDEGDVRITYQFYGFPAATPVNGDYTVNSEGDEIEMPDFLTNPAVKFTWNIDKFDTDDLVLSANYQGTDIQIELER